MGVAKILIVEDDRDQVMGLAVRLKASGYQIFSATDGTSAFLQACKLLPDLIILDIGLPAGDGFKVLEWLPGTLNTSVIPVIVLSGRDPSLTRERALRMGAKAFFQKPADNDDLLSTISELLTTGTVTVNPASPSANLPKTGVSRIRATAMADRIGRWRESLSVTPGDTDLMNDIAWVLATASDDHLRNVEEARLLVEKALSLLQSPSPAILDTLAVIHAATGHFAEAVEVARKGLALAQELGHTARAHDLRDRIRLYEADKTYTEDYY